MPEITAHFRIHIIFCYFVRSGTIYANGGILNYAGLSGLGWANSAELSNDFLHSFYLDFNESIVGLSGYNNRSFAFPLRCLVR